MKNLAVAMAAAGTALMLAAGAQAQTRVNVAHLAPFAPDLSDTAISVDVDGTEVLTGVEFNQSSGYLTLTPAGTAPGVTQVDVRTPPGGPVAITASPDLAADTDYTVAAIGDGANQPLALLPLVDDLSAPAAGNARLRIVHTAPFADTAAATEVSIRLQDGTVVAGLTNVPYGADSGYLELPAGVYDLLIATPDGSTELIDPEPVRLNDGDVISVFAVGDGANQPLGVTAVFADGTSAALPLDFPFEPIPVLNPWGLALLILVLAGLAMRRLA